MKKSVKEYRTSLPLEGKTVEVIFRVPESKNSKRPTWEELIRWGKEFAKKRKITPREIDKAIAKRRYA